jgi:aryl-alcohol dehydrogenase-like predicted oxidoreductase
MGAKHAEATGRGQRNKPRGSGHDWVRYFSNGRPRQEFLDMLARIRQVLTSDGRSLAQGALAWIWGRSPRTIPIPGFKNLRQVEENVSAMRQGPLSGDQMREISTLLEESRSHSDTTK